MNPDTPSNIFAPSSRWLLGELLIVGFLCFLYVGWSNELTDEIVHNVVLISLALIIPSEFLRHFVGGNGIGHFLKKRTAKFHQKKYEKSREELFKQFLKPLRGNEELRDNIEKIIRELNQNYKENYKEYLSGSYVREDTGIYHRELSYDIDFIQMVEAHYSTLISKDDSAYFVLIYLPSAQDIKVEAYPERRCLGIFVEKPFVYNRLVPMPPDIAPSPFIRENKDGLVTIEVLKSGKK